MPPRNIDCSSSTASWRGPGPSSSEHRDERRARDQSRLSIRAFGSVFGRLHGHGSRQRPLLFSSQSTGGRNRSTGEGTTICSRAGRASSPAATIPLVTIPGLAEVRSTWNRADQDSQEILPPWPHPSDLAATSPAELKPFVPNREAILRQVAQPRAGLFQKAVGEYPSPIDPSAVGWSSRTPASVRKTDRGQVMRSPSVAGRDEPGRSQARSVPRSP